MLFRSSVLSLASGTPLPFPAQTEGFEYGPGDWQISNGVWEMGVPTSGPTPDAQGNRAHEGVAVLATVLNGNYPDDQKSRISSIAFVVPTADQHPRLRFWHWWSFNTYFGSPDFGQVQVSTDNGATWKPLSPKYNSDSGGQWTRATLDLRAYPGRMCG